MNLFLTKCREIWWPMIMIRRMMDVLFSPGKMTRNASSESAWQSFSLLTSISWKSFCCFVFHSAFAIKITLISLNVYNYYRNPYKDRVNPTKTVMMYFSIFLGVTKQNTKLLYHTFNSVYDINILFYVRFFG